MEETGHIFNPGSPISDPDDDLLGRTAFAAGVADSLTGWTGKDSLVLAISGKWGDGKTSTKNLVLNALEKNPDKKPVVVEFTPWQWAAQDQVFSSFFSEIGTAIGQIDGSKKRNERLKDWQAYAELVRAGHQVTSGAAKLILLIFSAISVLGLIFGDPSSAPAFGGLLLALVVIASFLEKILAALAKMAEGVSKGLSGKLKLTAGSLSDSKKKIRDSLLGQDKAILVVMDDLDRLTRKEIVAVFQLIKANGDFPNLIYLLLFQRDIVENSLGETFQKNGRDYLEKIVQIQIDLPKIERARVEKVLFEKLDKIFESPDAKQQFDQTRWSDLFLSGLRRYFRNLRDVYRFLSTLEFHLSLFQQRPTLDINVLDLIGLEVLRLFEPDVFNRLPTAKSTLTGIADDESVIPRGKEYDDSVVDTILANASKDHEAEVREILKFLFPKCGPLTNVERQMNAEWARSRRICHPEFFDRYFLLALRGEDMSEHEFQHFISAAGDRKKFVEIFHGFKERGLAKPLLSRLDDFKDQIPLDIAADFLGALFDISMTEYAKSELATFGISRIDHIRRIIYWYLLQEPDQEKREQMFLEAIDSTEALYIPISLIMSDVEERHRHGTETLIRVERYDHFKALAVSKIRKAAEENSLFDHPELSFILYWWGEWDNQRAPSEHVDKSLSGPDEAIKLLLGFRSAGESSAGGRFWQANLEKIERYTSVERIAELIEQIENRKLSREEKMAISGFEKCRALNETGGGTDTDEYYVFEKDYDADGNLVSK